MDAIYPIVEYAHSFAARSLPATTVANTKRFILDTLAVMMAATKAQGCREVTHYVANWSGKPDAMTILGTRAPAPYAAMVNGMMAHALEYDDTYEPADVHGYAVVLPAVLAVAEFSKAQPVTGIDIIAAVTVGIDIAYRLGSAIKVYRGWQPTSTCGNFGATLAAARVAGCDKAQMHNAAGIAYGLVSGNFQAVVDASLTKRLQPGFASRAAVEAVLLSAVGITGAKNILEGTFGFFKLYEAGEYNVSALMDGLGVRFLGDLASMKPYPCCRFCHAAIDAALQIAEAADFSVGSASRQIDSVVVEIPTETFDYVGRDYHDGLTVVAAQFSVAYTVASALERRVVGLAEFTPVAIGDSAVAALARRIVARPVPGGRYDAVSVRARLKDGRTIERRVTTMKGESKNPLTRAELDAKVKSCLAYGGFSDGTAVSLGGWVKELEQSRDPIKQLEAIVREGSPS
jgi:2-methylcitrate dehydratase PrpD